MYHRQIKIKIRSKIADVLNTIIAWSQIGKFILFWKA